MVTTKKILRSFATIVFCLVMVAAFWATSGGWTQEYIGKLLGGNDNNGNNGNNGGSYYPAYPMVVRAAPVDSTTNIFDDRSNRKDIRFNNSVNRRVVILRLDDVQAFAWRNISIKLTDSVLERNMSMTLGVIPLGVKDDEILFGYLRNVSKDGRIEIAQHGSNHSVNEYVNLSEKQIFEVTNSSIGVIAEISGRYPVTMIPPYNAFDEINGSRALSRLGFKVVSGDYGVFNYSGYTMNIGYSATTAGDGIGLFPVETVINNCNVELNRTRACIITIHPQDYATGNGSLDTKKFETFTDLLDALKEVNATSVTFADLGKEEYTEGAAIDNTEYLRQEYIRKTEGMYIGDYVYDVGTSSLAFGKCDCERLKILKQLLPTGDANQDKRINYIMDMISWDYKYYTVDGMWSYCIRNGYNMSSPVQ